MANASPGAETLVEEGLALYTQGRLDQALGKWRAALLIDPELSLALEYVKYVEENRAALEATFHPQGGGGASGTTGGASESGKGDEAREASQELSSEGESASEAASREPETTGPRGGASEELSQEISARVSHEVDLLNEVSWDDLVVSTEDAPRDGELSPRGGEADVPGEALQAIDDETRRLDALSQPAGRGRRATPLTLRSRSDDESQPFVGFAEAFEPYEATPVVLTPVHRRPHPSTLSAGADSMVAQSASEDQDASGDRSPSDLGTSSREDKEADSSPLGEFEATGPGRPSVGVAEASSSPGLVPEEGFALGDAEEALPAEGVTPPSMIRARHPLSPEGAFPSDPFGPGSTIPIGSHVEVPAPVARDAPDPVVAGDGETADAGFIGLEDLLSGERSGPEPSTAHHASPLPPNDPSVSFQGPVGGQGDEGSGDAAKEPSSGQTTPTSINVALVSLDGDGAPERVGGATGPDLAGSFSGEVASSEPQDDAGGSERSWDGPTLDGLAREALNRETPTSDLASREADESGEETLAGAQQLFDQGTFEGALWICERILSVDPENVEAQELLKRVQAVLVHQYERDLGDLSRIPTTQVPMQEIVWHKLDHRAGFLLSRVDSMLSFDDILDISGMSRFEALRILAQLIEQGVIDVMS